MGFKEVASPDADTVIALGGYNKKSRTDNPTKIEGYYLGSKTVKSLKSKTGTALIHVFKTPKGDVGVWGKTDMDRKLEGVETGTMTRVTFLEVANTSNGNTMYKYKVEADPENTYNTAGSNEADVDEDYADETDVDEEEYADEVVPTRPTPAKTAATPAVSRTKELLKNRARA